MVLKGNAKKWLKVMHVFLAGTWGGGAASLFALHCLLTPASGPELYMRNLALISVDSYIIVPSAVGCLLTGLICCQFTSWGYLKYYWLMVKTGANLLFLVAGFFWFIPWLNRMAASSLTARGYARIDPSYDIAMYGHAAMAAAQVLLVFALVVVSVFKPWGKTGIRW